MGILTQLAQSSYYYGLSVHYSSDVSTETALALGFGMIAFMFFVSVIAYVVSALLLMRIFKKAGIERPWAAWVPIYNNWKLFEIGGQQGFWAILAIIPIVNIVSLIFMYIAMYNIGLKLGKEACSSFLPSSFPSYGSFGWLLIRQPGTKMKVRQALLKVAEPTPVATAAETPAVPPKPTA